MNNSNVNELVVNNGLGLSKEAPYSVETERTLLGLLMLNNDRYEEIAGYIKKEHFYMRVHQDIYDNIERILQKGFEASPITVHENMKGNYGSDVDLKQVLIDVIDNASQAYKINFIADIVYYYFVQRRLMDLASELQTDASHIPPDVQKERIQEIVGHVEAELFSIADTGTNETYTDLRKPLINVLDQIAEAKKNAGKVIGVTSGLTDIDKVLGGLHKSELIIVAARPAMGKTAFSVNMAQSAATALMNQKAGGAAVGIFSMEMSAEQLTTRILSSEAKVPSGSILKGTLDDEEFARIKACANTLADTQIIIDDTPALPISAFRSRARKMKRQYDIGMIIVDYLQLMRGSGNDNGNRVQEINEISQGLKAVARELNVPVIALSQLSRNVESRDNKRPILSDLRESGSIEQDADVVMFLYREDYYFEKTLPPEADQTEEQKQHLAKIRGAAECIISKNRKGATATVPMTFIPWFTTFKDRVPGERIEEYGVHTNTHANTGGAVVNANSPAATAKTEDAPW